MSYKENHVVKMVVGSRLWGTEGLESDTDHLYIVESVVSNLFLGRATTIKEGEDDIVWDTLKFHQLLKNGNPMAFIYHSEMLDADVRGEHFQSYIERMMDEVYENLPFYWSKVLRSNLGRLKVELGKTPKTNKDVMNILYLYEQSDAIIKYLERSGESELFYTITASNIRGIYKHLFEELKVSFKSENNLAEKSSGSKGLQIAAQNMLNGDYSYLFENHHKEGMQERMDDIYLKYCYSNFNIDFEY